MATQKKDFTDEFTDRINKIEADAKAIGETFTSICREAGISRATPDRWRKKSPKTILIITQMEGILARRKAELAAATKR